MAADGIRLPAGPDELDAPWLTRALHSSGVLAADRRVRACSAQPLGAGGGLIGLVAAVQLEYDGDAGAAPRRVIAKFPSPVPANRAVADTYDMYGREVRFYQQLAGSLPIGQPHCYFAGRAADSSDFVLLLEDLSDRRIGDQVVGSDVADARIVVDAMAALHAVHWGRTAEPQFGWLTTHANDAQIAGMEAGFAHGWPRFAAEFADLVPASVRRWGHRVGPATRQILTALCEGPLTVCHADFRLENMFFAARPEQPDFAIIDWQSITKSAGAQDLAYYLTQSLPTEVRRVHEQELLQRYLDGLRAGGVADYDRARLWQDYRRAALYLLDYAVVIAATLDLSNARGAAIARARSARACAALEDLDCAALLPA